MKVGDKIVITDSMYDRDLEPFYRSGDVGVVLELDNYEDDLWLIDFNNQGNTFVYDDGLWWIGGDDEWEILEE